MCEIESCPRLSARQSPNFIAFYVVTHNGLRSILWQGISRDTVVYIYIYMTYIYIYCIYM